MLNLHTIDKEILQSLIDAIPGNVYIKDTTGKCLYCNKTMLNYLGLQAKDIVGKTDSEILPPDQAQMVIDFDREVLSSRQPLSKEEIAHDGTIFLSKKTPLFDETNNIVGLLGVSFDITERKTRERHTETERNKTQMTLEYIVNNMPGHVFWQDTDLVFLGCNQLQAKSEGFDRPEQMIGKTNFDLLPEEEAKKVAAVNYSVLNSGKELMLEEQGLVNGKLRTFLSKKVPMRDEHGKVIGLLGIAFDITAEKEAAQLEAETLRKITATVAHELRTPLATIKFAADYLAEILPISLKDHCENKNNILKIPSTLDQTCQQANLFIDMQLIKTKVGRDDFSSHLLSATNLITRAIETYPLQQNQAKLIRVIEGSDFHINGNETYLRHVLYNLLKNSLYFIGSAGKGVISIWLEKCRDKGEIHFKDTATGIPANVLPKIFDCFTSNDNKHGTGIGLSFCKEIIEKHGGTISCESQYGDYTHFIISLPISNN